MFYNNYVNLCNIKGLSPSAAAEAMGFKRSVVSRWSNGTQPRQATLQKIATFFNVSVEELTKETPSTAPALDDQLKFALFGGDEGITEDMIREVKEFAALIKLREDQKRKG